jgi:hypothetical protein
MEVERAELREECLRKLRGESQLWELRRVAVKRRTR